MSTASRPLTDFVVLPSSQPSMPDCGTQPKSLVMNFQEGPLTVTADALREFDITKYQITKFYNEEIRKRGYYDQLKHIVEPTIKEFESPGNLDTSGEHDNTVVPGLQHKYRQTGLLLVTDKCASYCRYCFRKRLVGNDSEEIAPDYAVVANYMCNHPEMNNVLLSGGDAFTLNTHKLHRIMDHLLAVPNLTSIRFGTKMVAFYPPRFADPDLPVLFGRIMAAGKTPVIVGHFDHIGEISNEAIKNIQRLREVGVQFLNQSVLLSNVNDDPQVLADTFAKCHSIGVRPYYLFQGRPGKAAYNFSGAFGRGGGFCVGLD